MTLVCCVTVAIGVVAYFTQLNYSAQREARFNSDKMVQLLGQELDAYLEGQSGQLAVQAVMPSIQQYFNGQSDQAEITSVLNSVCASNNGAICYLLNKEGVFVASSDFAKKSAAMGESFAFRPYYLEAVSGESAIYLALGAATRKRGIYFSHIVKDENDNFIGMVVNKFSVENIESRFSKLPGKMALMGPDGVVFAANNPAWIFNSLLPLNSIQQDLIANSRQFGQYSPEVIPVKWRDPQSVEDEHGDRFYVSHEYVNLIPGWQLTYLVNEESTTASALNNKVMLISLSFLAAVVLVMVIYLFRQGSYNILKRHRVEARLRQSEARLLQLSQITTEAVIMHRDGTIIDFNEMAEKLFAYSREELLKTPITDLYSPEQFDYICSQLKVGKTRLETEMIRSDGSTLPVEINIKNSQVDGKDNWMSAIRDITDRKRQEEKIQYQAQFDALTNLPNRKLLGERLDSAINRARANDNLVVLMFIDLDDFKKINDTQGHEVGDELLKSVSSRLQDVVRETDTLARYGGDEFILMLEDQDSLYDAEVVARKVLSVLKMEFRLKGRSYFISGSIGIATAPGDGIAAEELLKKADTAMYRVKDEGRNNYCFYTPDMNIEIINRLEVEHQLRGVLSRNELHLHYQPIYCLKRNTLLGAEVLVRWNNQALGPVSPDQFIPVAEQTGLIIPIGEWILRQACMQAKQWLTQIGPDFKLGVNVSPRQFKGGHIVQILLQILEETEFPPEQLIIEITEGVLIKNDESTGQTLAQLKAMGISISMDDFGTGYSSLSYLKQFPFDTLKIDRSFIRDLAEDPGDQQLVLAAIAMAKGLGMAVVAEGVEDQFQLEFLSHAGCNAVQGFYLGRPVGAQKFTEDLLNSKDLKSLTNAVVE